MRRIFSRLSFLPLFVLLACGDGGTEPRPREVGSVEVILTPDTLAYGAVATAHATVYDEDGAPIPDAVVEWTSSDEDVVRVSAEGQVSAHGVGAAYVTASAGSQSAEIAVTVVQAEVVLVADDPTPSLYQAIAVALPAGATSAGSVAGVAGADTLFFEARADTLSALVAGLPPGSVALRIELSANQVGLLALNVQGAPLVANPDQRIAEVEARAQAALASLDTLDTLDAAIGTDVVAVFAAAFSEWADTASAESRLVVAQMIEANPALFDPASVSPMLGSGQATGGCFGDANITREARLSSCLVYFAAATWSVSLGTRTLSVCNAPATPFTFGLCLASITATVGGAVLALNAASVIVDLPAAIHEEHITVATDIILDGLSNSIQGSASARATAAGDTIISAVPYRLQAHAAYRSVEASDASRGGELAELVDVLETFDGVWDGIVRAANALPSWLRSRLPTLPVSPVAPAVAGQMVTDTVPFEYLTLEGTSDNVRAELDAETRVLTVMLLEEVAADFTADFRYMSPIDDFVSTIEGSVKALPVLEIVSGLDQTAAPGEWLPQPLVVRVHDGLGNPIAGVQVEWLVWFGGGTLDGSPMTDENGLSSVRLQLGGNEGQEVIARVWGQDGNHLAGSPATFRIYPDTELGRWALVSMEGGLPHDLGVTDGWRREIVAGEMAFGEGGSFLVDLAVDAINVDTGERVPSGAEQISGTYTRNGNTLQLSSPDDPSWSASATFGLETIETDLGNDWLGLGQMAFRRTFP